MKIDHKEQTLKQLSPQFRKPGMQTVVKSICDLYQDSEDKAVILQDFLKLESERRDTLEATAKVLGIRSFDEDLEGLREKIQGEIALNNSNGSIPDLINIIQTLFHLTDIHIHSMPGLMRIETTEHISEEKSQAILKIANQATSAGIGIERILHSGDLKLDSDAGLDGATLACESEVENAN